MIGFAVTHRHRTPRAVALCLAAVLASSGCASTGSADSPDGGQLILATTTSAQNTGLLDVLIPKADASTGCTTKAVAVGSGEALAMGEQGNADVVLVHSPEDEREFMAGGHGTSRKLIMHNDFVLIGPPGDPAGVAETDSSAEALTQIAERKAKFVSRGDDSGTHSEELALWRQAAVKPHGEWYVETGQGMGETLTIASQTDGYTLTDRATFLTTKGLSSRIVLDGPEELHNPYHVITVDHPATNTQCAKAFAEWLSGEQGQGLIDEFGAGEYSRQLFVPDAMPR